MNEEQLELIGLTADSPRGVTKKAERDLSQSAAYVMPKKQVEDREALCTITMEEISTYENLKLAFSKVKANDGAPGPDKQTIKAVEANLENILGELQRELRQEEYEPGNIRRVWIPKSGGGERGLGIPDVVDRIVQQAIHQKMQPMYELEFHGSSHGFRPGKSCHTAIAEAKSYIEDGYEWVVDIDLEKFFDRVNHDRLMSTIEKKVQDRKVMYLLRKLLRAKVIMPDGVVVKTEEGVPQGGPLSPLLSNIVLDELDRELAQRGHRFVRYADDCNIYVRSERAGERVMSGVCQFIEKRLKLKVNTAKSAVSKPEKRHFLGFRMKRDPLEGEVSVMLSVRSEERIDNWIRELTPRNWGGSLDSCIKRLSDYLVGWMGYFRICTKGSKSRFHEIDGHVRRRLRAIQLKHWKRKRYIVRNLIELGVPAKTPWMTIYGGKKSLWRMSITPAVHKGLSNAYFKGLGLYSLEQGWRRWNPRPIVVNVPIQLSLDIG